jgi:glutamate carboxypeptidase
VSPEQLLRNLEDERGRFLAELEAIVALETPSGDKPALDAFADVLAAKVRAIDGASVDLIRDEANGNHLRAEWAGVPGARPVLVLGHYDTVWPLGTIERMPFKTIGDSAYGPGILDMKTGILQGLWAIRAYRQGGGERPIVLVLNSDEEIGSEGSRALIEAEARRCAFALVLEPALDDGRLKTSRRGLARYRITVTGRASHSGLAPGAGLNAIDELCELLQRIHRLADPAHDTDVNVGRIEGGTRFNVVAGHAGCEVGVRVKTQAESTRIATSLAEIRPSRKGASVEIEGGPLWPPMEQTPPTVDLGRQAVALAVELGFQLGTGHAGGASDACHCAAGGAPVLDGLGAVGGGAHAEDEHIVISEIPRRIALLVRLIATGSTAYDAVEGRSAPRSK